jgi:hypothetical protein
MRVTRNGKKVLAYRRFQVVSVHSLFTKVGGIPFREFVEYCDFDNKESLLGLIQRNIKQQEGQIEEGTIQANHSLKCNAESTFTEELMEPRSWRLRTWFIPIKTSHIMTFGLGGSKSLAPPVCTHVLTGI